MRFKINPNELKVEGIVSVCLIQTAQICADVQDDRDVYGAGVVGLVVVGSKVWQVWELYFKYVFESARALLWHE